MTRPGRGLALLLVVIGLLLVPAAAQATTITVHSTADSLTGCTLRNAIIAANQNSAHGACAAGQQSPTVDKIDFAVPAGSTITLASTLPAINGPLDIVEVRSGAGIDRVVNGTAVPSSLNGGPGNDALLGGSSDDVLTGGPGADTFKGGNGNDTLFAHDLASDSLIDCDGGTKPGTADKAELDLLPKDPNSIVHGCETVTRN